MVKVVCFSFDQCLVPLTRCLLKGSLKGDFLEIFLTSPFRVRHMGNTSAIRVIFFLKYWKFNVGFTNAVINWENVFHFWDSCMWIGCLKLSVLTREYLSSVINMLTNILKNFHITKRVLFPTQLPSQWSINMVKVVWVRFQHCLLHLTCYFPKGPRKEDFLEISLTTFFGVRNLGNTSAMRTMFFFKKFKI